MLDIEEVVGRLLEQYTLDELLETLEVTPEEVITCLHENGLVDLEDVL